MKTPKIQEGNSPGKRSKKAPALALAATLLVGGGAVVVGTQGEEKIL